MAIVFHNKKQKEKTVYHSRFEVSKSTRLSVIFVFSTEFQIPIYNVSYCYIRP